MKNCKDCGFREGIVCTSEVKCYKHEQFKPLNDEENEEEKDFLNFVDELLKICEEEAIKETTEEEKTKPNKKHDDDLLRFLTNVTNSIPSTTEEEKKIFEEIYTPKLVVEDKTNPSHYKTTSVETIDSIYNILGEEAFYGYTIGNVIKYVSRYNTKNGVEDLEKARWYLCETIARMSGTDNEYRK